MKFSPTIIIDSREQTPWSFCNLPTERAALDAGDYSLVGLTHAVAIERKSLDDLLACIGRERDRFKRELARLRGFRFRTLVVEASYADLERGGWRSKIQPAHVLGSLTAWMAQFGLPIMLVGTHQAGAEFCERYLFQAARCIAAENKAIGCCPAVA